MDKKKEKKVNISSLVLSNGDLVEMIYDKKNNKTQLATFFNGKIELVDEYQANGKTYVPYEPDNNLISQGIILFPSSVSGPDPKSCTLTLYN